MKLSIILVNFNNRFLTEQTIKSIENSETQETYEIIVVDNSTRADEKMSFDETRYALINSGNKGFGSACNLGATFATGEYFLFLNSDVEVAKDSLEKSLCYMADSNADLLGIKIVLPDGRLDKGCKRGFPTPAASLYYLLGLDRLFPQSKKIGAYHQTFIGEDEIAPVECISGAYMLFRKRVFQNLNGFDENFFMHGEDIDICYRAKKSGYITYYYPEASIIHYKGGSSGGKSSKKVVRIMHESMWLFYRKHYYSEYSKPVSLLVYIGIKAKLYLSLLKSA